MGGFTFHRVLGSQDSHASLVPFTSLGIRGSVDFLTGPFLQDNEESCVKKQFTICCSTMSVDEEVSCHGSHKDLQLLIIVPFPNDCQLWEPKVQMMRTRAPNDLEVPDLLQTVIKCFPSTVMINEFQDDEDDDDESKRKKSDELVVVDIQASTNCVHSYSMEIITGIRDVLAKFGDSIQWGTNAREHLLSLFSTGDTCFVVQTFSISTSLLEKKKMLIRSSFIVSHPLVSSLNKPDSKVLRNKKPTTAEPEKLYIPSLGFSRDNYSVPELTINASELEKEFQDEFIASSEAWFQHRIFSLDTDKDGAGKTSAEMLKDMKRRHASGSRTKIVTPTVDETSIYKVAQRLISYNCPKSQADRMERKKDVRMTYKSLPFKSLRLKTIFGPHPNIPYLLPLIER